MDIQHVFSTTPDALASRLALSRVCSLITLGIGVGSLIGYAIHNPMVLAWANNGVPIALPTAVALTLLSLANLILPVRL